MPPHDETSPVGLPAGSVRRPPPARATRSGGGGRPDPRRPDPRSARRGGDRGRTTAARGEGAATVSARPAAGKRGKGKRTAKQKRRRVYKVLASLVLGGLLLLGVFVGVVYANTKVPSLDDVSQAQTTIVYYSDGTTEMARLGSENRINVTLDQVSDPARDAILAAENRNFYSDPGISVTGIARAAWNNLTGGSTQGGSTITQQYVKNTLLTADQTFSRKFQELFLAVKLDNNYSKDEILEGYLNTIYFGRGAYGIQAAAQTYFGVDASALTAQQGAVLAVLVRSPSAYDPANNPEGAQDRWGLVLDGMVEQGWLSQADREASTYPEVLPVTGSSLGLPDGPEGLIVQQAINEVRSRLNLTQDELISSGYRIVTTVNPAYQQAAVDSVNSVMQGEPGTLRQALVAVDPRTGGVLAYYGGATGTGYDYANNPRPPGSSFKPYVMATALQQGIAIDSRRNGSSPQTFPDRPDQPVRNSGGASCGNCTLVQAMTRSLNTTFYGLAYEVGADNVRTTALAAMGLGDTWQGTSSPIYNDQPILVNPDSGVPGASIGIGEYAVRPIDQAVGFATLANGGVRHATHFVSQITDSEGGVVLAPGAAVDAGTQAVPADVASDTTLSTEGVAEYSRRSLDGDRPVASKTGTQGQQDSTVNSTDAWMVGYTPSISTAVWMGSDDNSAIINANGSPIFGSGLPGQIWQEFMDRVLAGTPVEELPTRQLIDGDNGDSNAVPDPTTEAPRTTQAPVTTTEAPVTTTEAPPTTTQAPPTTTQAPPTTTQAPTTTQGPPTIGLPPGNGQPNG
ncbi:transglycosylase domain-containing protein [Klenkia brasiliensis]|uniref:Membrane carboxypeptidase (Penicillin-binding protein) n=1 Tax=Klenkia brasiliensis TaxID=333142 RepID=A0A1G7XL08_9ACTN|nr:transglycosylase domain-containing protein [Klenkia brasiliensis]SDG84741.1 Membrane carboxypeptidase (penicillin-binding protein) [Klenkia brasiliensis]